MRTSYQNATAIYLQRVKVYYRALSITRTNSSYAVPVASQTPTDDVVPLLPGNYARRADSGPRLRLAGVVHCHRSQAPSPPQAP